MRFKPLFVLPIFIGVMALAGCASKPTPLPDGAQMVNVQDEALAVTQNLNCEWLQLPDPMYPAKGNDFACVADTFASVILFVEPTKVDKNLTPQVEKIKLVWKNWGEHVNMKDTKTDASRFVAFLAQRYFAPEYATKLVDMFFGTDDKTLTTGNLNVLYTFRRQPALGLHRLEIQNTDPERRLFAFSAPHQLTSNGD